MTLANSISPQFSRIRPSVDVALMHACRLVVIGCGGAAESVVDLARQGVGSFVLIDPDEVQKENLATQGYAWTDIGTPKVEALARRIRSVNPHALVITIRAKLQDLDDRQMAGYLRPENFPSSGRVVLAGYTDDFFAQAAVHRLALKYGVFMLAAQVWEGGLSAEIIFTAPSHTKACARCILGAPRYEAFRTGNGAKGNSAGTPIPTIALLNANCTFLTLALLHAGADNHRFGDVVRRYADRNFLVIKCDPSCPELAFAPEQFRHPERHGFMGTVMLAFPPDPNCPDCHGQGACEGPAYWIGDYREIFRLDD